MSSTKSTKQQLIDEIIRCGKDPVYFLNTYARIQHPEKGIIPFKTYSFQDDIIKGYIQNRFNIVLKARQLGVTTITAGYIAWLTLFHRDKNALIVATKRETAQTMMRMVKNIFKYLPKWLTDVARIVVNNKHSLELSNGSRVKAVSLTGDVGRSEAVSFLVVDEVAFIPNFADLWVGLWPTISRGGSAALLSTPNGCSNFFHKQYVQARDGLNNFNCRFGTYTNPKNPYETYNDRFMWWVCPDYDEVWFSSQTAGKSPREIAQEYNCFEGNTRILTNLGFKKIKDINIGDKVLTHKGRFKSVLFKNSKISNDIFQIRTHTNYISTLVTFEHPILSENEQWKKTKDFIVNERVCNYPKNIEINNEFKELDLYGLIDKVNFKVLLTEDANKIYVNDRKFKTKITRKIKIDYDLGILIGLYLAEGCKSQNYLCFSFNKDTELSTWVVEICDILKHKFAFENSKIYNSVSKASILQINSQIITKFISLFVEGIDCYTKHLSSFSYENGNKEFFNGIIDGLFLGDGCLKFEYNKSFSTVSQELVYDLKYLLTVCGFKHFSIRKQNKQKEGLILGRKVNISDSYHITLLNTQNKQCYKISKLDIKEQHKFYSYKNIIKENNDFVITSLFEKNINTTPTEVYNIEVDEDNSFVTEHFVVHNCNFLASGDTFIDSETLNNLERTTTPPNDVFPSNRDVWIWEKPRMNGFYLIAIDCSRGDATDFSAFHVIRLDANPLVQVAEYKGKIRPDQLGYLVYEVAEYYGNAIVAPENNSGWSAPVIMKLQEIGYSNIYYSKKRMTGFKKQQLVDSYYAQQRVDYLPGYSITTANRIEMLAKMEQYVRLRDILINSPRLLDEFKTFIVNANNKPEAQRGMSDDLVMALAGALWIRDEAFLHTYKTDSYAEAMLQGMSVSSNRTSDFSDFNFNNNNFYDRTRIKEHLIQQNKIVMGNGQTEDLNWLFNK